LTFSVIAILNSTPRLLVASVPAELARRIWATQLTASLLRTLEVVLAAQPRDTHAAALLAFPALV
jgi:hypothetical protein